MSAAFTPLTLADHWGVSSATVRNLINAKSLRAFRVGRQYRIRREAVEEYEACQTIGSSSTEASTPLSDPLTGGLKERRLGPVISPRPAAG